MYVMQFVLRWDKPRTAPPMAAEGLLLPLLRSSGGFSPRGTLGGVTSVLSAFLRPSSLISAETHDARSEWISSRSLVVARFSSSDSDCSTTPPSLNDA